MEAGPAPEDSPRMDRDTFTDNFSDCMKSKTYLCYEVEVFEGDNPSDVRMFKGYLKNESIPWPGCHAEICFLNQISSSGLDKEKRYVVTLYISWSPCYNCAQKLVEFLGRNQNVTLHIFAVRIYDIYVGYEEGLRSLHRAGAQISIMTSEELKHCWETFVDHQGQPFHPWFNIDHNYQILTQRLESILNTQGN
ncbi:DNA dC-_dU-editing enzyme APOBEC-3A-like [Saccopteryx bilineata]|uniref:DNA dC->dU-editing enzyme APOBEC-3A-like n=1 Tax=Saccopteryx bilineata TaxID=59482 RepID=UPI00338FF0BB